MATFQIYMDNDGLFRWRLLTEGMRKIAVPTKGYVSREECEEYINSVKQLAPNARIQ